MHRGFVGHSSDTFGASNRVIRRAWSFLPPRAENRFENMSLLHVRIPDQIPHALLPFFPQLLIRLPHLIYPRTLTG